MSPGSAPVGGALKSTPAQYLAAILAAGRDLMSQAVGRLDQATDVFKREQRNLAGVIGMVRTRHGYLNALLKPHFGQRDRRKYLGTVIEFGTGLSTFGYVA